MVFCPFCGSDNLDKARFCHACGERIEELLARARSLAEGDPVEEAASPALAEPPADHPVPPPVPPLVVDASAVAALGPTDDEPVDGGVDVGGSVDGDDRDETGAGATAGEAGEGARDGDLDFDDNAALHAEGEADHPGNRDGAAELDHDLDGHLDDSGTDQYEAASSAMLDDEWVPDEGILRRLTRTPRRRAALAISVAGVVALTVGFFGLARHKPAQVAAPAPVAPLPDLAMVAVVAPPAEADAGVAVAQPVPVPVPAATAPDAAVTPVAIARARERPPAEGTSSERPNAERPRSEPRGTAPAGSDQPPRPRKEAARSDEPAEPRKARASGDSDPGAQRPFTSRSAASSAVRQVAKAHEDEGYDCFISAFPTAAAGMRARVSVRFVLGIEGKASEVNVSSNSTGNEELASCLVSRVYGWTFPPSAAGDVPVSHTFSFVSR